MWQDIILQAEKEDEPFGHKPRKPAAIKAIEATQKSVQNTFGVDLPQAYIDFLKFRNGFGFEGLLIYNAVFLKPEDAQEGEFYTDIIDANEQWRDGYDNHKNYLFFGESGMYLYCQNLNRGEYEQQDRVSGDVLEIYPDFFHLIVGAIEILLSN